MSVKRKIGHFPLWAAYMTLGPPTRLGDTAQLPVRVVVHKWRAILWLAVSGRLRFGTQP